MLGQGAQLDLRIDKVGRAVATTGREDAAHRLDDVGFVRVEELAHRGITLGDQCAVVEECGDLGEWLVVDSDLHAAHCFKPRDRFCECSFRCVVAEEGQR